MEKFKIEKDGKVYRIKMFRQDAVVVSHDKKGFWNKLFKRKWYSAKIVESWVNCAFPVLNESKAYPSQQLFGEIDSWSTRKEAEDFLKKINGRITN